jgi:hypothetical protein
MPIAQKTICTLRRPAVIQNLTLIKCYADPHSSRRTGDRSTASADVTKVLGERRQRRFSVVLIESTFFVEVSVQTNDFIALSDEFRR